MSKNRVKLSICGSEFVIGTDDSENYMRSLGDEVEKGIQDYMDRNERVSITMAAIVTALSCCDEAHKAAGGADNLRSQIKDYLEDSSRARAEAEESKKEIERLKKEIQALRNRLTEAEISEKLEETVGEPKPAVPAPKTAPVSPVQRAQTGSYTRVQGEPIAEQDNFMSFFEKDTDE